MAFGVHGHQGQTGAAASGAAGSVFVKFDHRQSFPIRAVPRVHPVACLTGLLGPEECGGDSMMRMARWRK